MSNSTTARELQSAKVYQLQATRTATLPPEISAILERLDELAILQQRILDSLRPNLEQSGTPESTGVSSLSAVVPISTLQSVAVSSTEPWVLGNSLRITDNAVRVLYEVGSNVHTGGQAIVRVPEGTSMPNGVPLPKLLTLVAVVLAAFSMTSMVTWLVGSIPLIHPVVSLMSLFASPFIYWMGRAAKAELESNK